MKKCGPEGRDCIAKNSAETFNCSMSCKGMYADTNWKAAEMEKDKEKYVELSSEYVNFKREFVKHFEFTSATPSSMYGKQILLAKKNTETRSNHSGYFWEMLLHVKMLNTFQGRSDLIPHFSWYRSTLTRRPSTTSRETRRSRPRPS